MEKGALAKRIEFSILKANLSPVDVEKQCAIAGKLRVGAVVVNSSYVKLAKKLLRNIPVIATIGYPLGACISEAKYEEARRCVKNGADGLDMVMHIGMFRQKNYKYVQDEIRNIVKIAKNRPVKAIIETGFLTAAEIIKASMLAMESGASFVKTGSGYGPDVKISDVKIVKSAVKNKIKIKASAGIRTKKQALSMIRAGADTIGTSSALEILK